MTFPSILRALLRVERSNKAILAHLKTMPSQADLQAVVTEVRASVDAAADRVINTPVVEVPQSVIDELFIVRAKADSIAPAQP